MLELGKKTVSKVKGLGKKVGTSGLSIGKNVVKTGAVVAGVLGTAVKVASVLKGDDREEDYFKSKRDAEEEDKKAHEKRVLQQRLNQTEGEKRAM